MECDICLLEWNSSIRTPRWLACGHTFCEECWISILTKCRSLNKKFQCPTCNAFHDITNEANINNLIKNYNLLRIVDKLETKRAAWINNKTNMKNSIMLDSDAMLLQNANFMPMITGMNQLNTNIPQLKSGFILKSNDNIEPRNKNISSNYDSDFNFDFAKNCDKHNLPIHSYAAGTNLQFCDKCINESPWKTYPLRSILKEIKRKIDLNNIKVCLTKNEIEKIQEFFDKYLHAFEKTNKLKIEKVFNYFYSLIRFYHNDADQLLKQCVAEQRTKINTHWTELKTLNDQLIKLENDLIEISALNENGALHSIDKINKIQVQLSNFINYNWEFEMYSMNIGLNSDKKERLFTAIQEAYHLEVEFLEIDNELPSIKNILCIENNWPCICGQTKNNINDVKCSSCGLYRRIETLPDVYNSYKQDSAEISDKDIKLFTRRRKEEGQEFQTLLKERSSTGKFYAIDIEWFWLWKAYITNDTSVNSVSNDLKNISRNRIVGVLPPGPVTNLNIADKIDKDKYRLKKNWVKNKNYIVVNDLIWDWLSLNYNGGPAIRWNSIDNHNIYNTWESIVDNEYKTYSQIKGLFTDIPTDKKSSIDSNGCNYDCGNRKQSDEFDNLNKDVNNAGDK